MSSLNKAINDSDYYISYLFTDKYVHRCEVDFEEMLNIDRDGILNLISYSPDGLKFITYKDFLSKIFDIIESQNDFNKAIAYNDLIFIYKYYCVNQNYSEVVYDEESSLHYKMLFESVELKFREKLETYFIKKKISVNEQNLMYKVIDEFMQNLLRSSYKRTPAELTRKYFPVKDYHKYYNKVEYVLQMLLNDIIKEIKGTEQIV
jgi:hypothetical protein